MNRLHRWAAAVAMGWTAATGLFLAPQPVAAAQPQTTTVGPITAPLPAPRDRGFLWTATKDGRTSFLYGTVHVGRPEWTTPGPRVAHALATSDVLALELDLTDPDVVAQVVAGMAPSEDVALPPSVARRLRRHLREAGLPDALAQQQVPEMQALTLTLMSVARDGLSAEHGVDLALARAAMQQGLPIESLEDPALQVRLLRSPDAVTRTATVSQLLDDLETGKARRVLLRVADLWERGLDAEMADYARWCGCADTAHDRAALREALDDRNPALAGAVDRLHTSGRRVFAAVGALHLVGPQGLPRLLARDGYTVQRVRLR